MYPLVHSSEVVTTVFCNDPSIRNSYIYSEMDNQELPSEQLVRLGTSGSNTAETGEKFYEDEALHASLSSDHAQDYLGHDSYADLLENELLDEEDAHHHDALVDVSQDEVDTDGEGDEYTNRSNSHENDTEAGDSIDEGDDDVSSVHSLKSCDVSDSSSYSCDQFESNNALYNDSHIESYYDANRSTDDNSYCSDGTNDSFLNDDGSVGFPPGHILRLDELDALQNSESSSDLLSSSKSINPSILPSYFFCPITQTIMRDPVITPDGVTYERRAILRYLVLYPENDPLGNPLKHEDLMDDVLVKQAIDKARKEAWVRYVMEFNDEDVDKIIENELENVHELLEPEGDGESLQDRNVSRERYSPIQQTLDQEGQRSQPPPLQRKTLHLNPKQNDDLLKSNFQGALPAKPTDDDKSHTTSHATDLSGNNIHGWNTPLGVHKIVCSLPGLVVTTDIHRRSPAVKRKIIKKSLVVEEDSNRSSKKRGQKKKDRLKNDVVDLGDGIKVPMAQQQPHPESPRSQGKQLLNQIHHTAAQAARVVSPKKLKKGSSKHQSKSIQKEWKKANRSFNTTVSVITRDLILLPGSHVEILETVVHGGRVRGKIVWEEEVAMEFDPELLLQMKRLEEEVRADEEENQFTVDEEKYYMSRTGASPFKVGGSSNKLSSIIKQPSFKDGKKGKGKSGFLRRKSNDSAPSTPFTSELYSQQPHHSPVRKESLSSPPLTTIKYSGWISLQWAGTNNNHEREESIKRQRANVDLMADEGEGPWSEPLPLGVYCIQGEATSGSRIANAGVAVKQLPLCDEPGNEHNITDILVARQSVEVVETRVVVMKKKLTGGRLSNQKHFGMNAAAGVRGIRVVRARCMVPIVVPPRLQENFVPGSDRVAKVQRKFRGGWITISEEDGNEEQTASGSKAATAHPIPLGAYTVVSTSGCAVTEGASCESKLKSILPSGSCMEVVTTRIEFEEKHQRIECSCGREGVHNAVAVRGLLASGGHVTLFVLPISTSGTFDNLCACGQLVQRTNAKAFPSGMYRIIHPEGVYLTMGIAESQIITKLDINTFVNVVETGVEAGCVRGRVNVSVGGSNGVEFLTGWINLFEPPAFSWAELLSKSEI